MTPLAGARALMLLGLVAATGGTFSAEPAGQAPRPGATRQAAPGPSRPRGIQVMTMTGPWPDGGPIPVRHAQIGDEVSPALSWSGAPEGVVSYVLMMHDMDVATGQGLDETLHWMVWNLPAATTSLVEGVPQGPTRPDGSHQISATGPSYRGPAAPATGPAHHYLFELYALDVAVTVPPTGLSPADTRAAVRAAMAGHVRAKAVYTGLYRQSR
jgi:Raf kinase inhibitor-like YbhB/YbcL family protein